MKNKNYIALVPAVLLIIVVVFASCKNNKMTTEMHDGKIFEEYKEKELIVWYSRTPCFGTCPFFDLYIFNDLSVNYEGKKFVDSVGLYYSSIGLEEYQRILDVAERINFYEMDDKYDNSQVMDLPAIYTQIKKDSTDKKVMNRFKGPKELSELYEVLDDIIANLDLVKQSIK